MNLLLDTHIALWAITDDPKLPSKARELISDATNTVWVSVASVWEISIKHALGKGDMPISGQDALNYFRQAGYKILEISAAHAIGTEPLDDHHKDPFDRLLIAQAQAEPMHLLTKDEQISKYGKHIIYFH